MIQKGSSLLRTARLFLCKGPITDMLLLVIFLCMITILLRNYKGKQIMLALPILNFIFLHSTITFTNIGALQAHPLAFVLLFTVPFPRYREMAEGMLYGVAQKIIEELGSWAFKEVASLWNVEAELENIKNTVSTIQAVLRDAAEQQTHSHQVKDWLEKLKDAVYEVDDLLGEFFAEALRQGGTGGNIPKKVRNFFSTPIRLVLRREMSGKINAMKQKLNAIAEDRKLFHLKEYHVEPPVSMNREETHSFVLDEKVIGREDDKKAIIKLLLEPNNEENVSIVPIVGIGGLGKTTLAQFVYNDKNIQEHFELKMWICISDVFDVKMIIQKIISATGMQPVDHSMDKLQDQLRNIINQKKYLLVLDRKSVV